MVAVPIVDKTQELRGGNVPSASRSFPGTNCARARLSLPRHLSGLAQLILCICKLSQFG
jgi:hypothetical protein